MMILVSAIYMALTWCKLNDSPRSSGYEFFSCTALVDFSPRLFGLFRSANAQSALR